MGLSPHKCTGPESMPEGVPTDFAVLSFPGDPEAAGWGTSVSSHISLVNAVGHCAPLYDGEGG